MVDSIDIDTLTAKDTVEEADDKNEKKNKGKGKKENRMEINV
jgi:hypothetical protein